MANTSFHGKGGSVSLAGGGQANITSWSVDVTVDTVEATAMEDTWKTHLSGIKDWTASVEANIGSSIQGFSMLGTQVACVFHTGSGSIDLVGQGIVTGVSVNTSSSDAAKVTISIQGTGALA